MMVRRSSRPSRAQLRTIARSKSRSAIKPASPTKKKADSHNRDTSPPSLAKNEAPMNSRNTNAQDEIMRVSCRNWPRNTWTS